MQNEFSSSSKALTCTHCGKTVNGGTYINNVFYCPMCASIITKNLSLTLFNEKNNLPSYGGPKEPSPCDGCSNNPKNGGSGICHCILGSMNTFC